MPGYCSVFLSPHRIISLNFLCFQQRSSNSLTCKLSYILVSGCYSSRKLNLFRLLFCCCLLLLLTQINNNKSRAVPIIKCLKNVLYSKADKVYSPNKLSGHNGQIHYCWPVYVHSEFFQPVLLCPSAAPPAVNTRRSSNFCLVGSHKITLASLGHSKFPLDKVMIWHGVVHNCFWHLQKLKPNTCLLLRPEYCVYWWKVYWTLLVSWFFFIFLSKKLNNQ